MKLKEIREKLEKLDKLKHLIDTKVKKIYEEHGQLTEELTLEIAKRKGGDHADGILKTSLVIKFRDGEEWELRPNYIKNGQLSNTLWKPVGVHAFSINHLPF